MDRGDIMIIIVTFFVMLLCTTILMCLLIPTMIVLGIGIAGIVGLSLFGLTLF